MPGTGTLINCAAILSGGVLGLFLKKGLPGRFKSILIQVCGLCVLVFGICGTME